jgi:alkanesulfonate monooxygenase SsuD/methylene tetrahydromethanopterin reductase-like flavin-dependent oxidoreductase (luciferase family)
MVAVQVIAAETDESARRLFTTPQQRFLRLIRNQPVELLPPVDSMDPLWQDLERAAVEEPTASGDRGIECHGENGAGEVGK